MIRKLAEDDEMLDEGATVAEVARSFRTTGATWNQRKNTYGGIVPADASGCPGKPAGDARSLA